MHSVLRIVALSSFAFLAVIQLAFVESSPYVTQQAPAQDSPSAAKPKKTGGLDLALPPAPDPAAVARGTALFKTSCAFCHGSQGTGGDSGPNLIRSALVLHDHGKGETLGPLLSAGRIAKGMPKFDFTASQVKDLAAFLLSRTIAAANRKAYKVLDITTGDQQAGKDYFAKNCVACHSISGDLAHIGSKFDVQNLQERIAMPDSEKTVAVTSKNGPTYSGKLLHLDDFSISLQDAQGHFHSWTLSPGNQDIAFKIGGPANAHLKILALLKDGDLHNLVAFLESVR